MSQRLFTEHGASFTHEANAIVGEIEHAINNVFIKYPDADMRDLMLIAIDAATGASLAMILKRKRDL
jgi:hypothetical protein